MIPVRDALQFKQLYILTFMIHELIVRLNFLEQ